MLHITGVAMGKRMTATEKWDKAWFRKLSPRQKSLWQFLCDKCDHAGMWEIDFDNASHYVNDVTPITAADLKAFGDRVEMYSGDKLWIVSFCDFQYENLSEKCPAHKPVFKLLKKYSLLDRVLNRVSNTLQEKEKDIEKEKEKEKEPETVKDKDEFNYEFVEKSEEPPKQSVPRGTKVLSKLEIFETIFTDEIFIDGLAMVHRNKDIKLAFEECYIHHSNAPNPPTEIGEWKQKLNTWLINTKNGTGKKGREDTVNSRREAFARRHGTGAGG
jgi:hypothetical protein